MFRWLRKVPRSVSLASITLGLILLLLAIYGLVGYAPNYAALERRNLSAIQDLALTIAVDQRTDIFDALQTFADPIEVDAELSPPAALSAPRRDIRDGWRWRQGAGGSDRFRVASGSPVATAAGDLQLPRPVKADLVYVALCKHTGGNPKASAATADSTPCTAQDPTHRPRRDDGAVASGRVPPTILLLTATAAPSWRAPRPNPPGAELEPAARATLVPSAGKDSPQPERAKSISVAGEPHLVFARRVQLLADPDLPETAAKPPGSSKLDSELLLIGLVPAADFRQEALQLPYHLALFLCLVTLAAFVSLPFIRLRQLRPREELTAPVVLQVLLAGSLGLMLLTLTVADVIFYNGLKNMVDDQLRRLGDEMVNNIEDERDRLDALLTRLESVDAGVIRSLAANNPDYWSGCLREVNGVHCGILVGGIGTSPDSRPLAAARVSRILAVGPSATATRNRFFERIVWIDSAGTQLVRLGVGRASATPIPVADRPTSATHQSGVADEGRQTALYSIVDSLQAEAITIAVKQPLVRATTDLPVVVLRPATSPTSPSDGFSFVVFDDTGTRSITRRRSQTCGRTSSTPPTASLLVSASAARSAERAACVLGRPPSPSCGPSRDAVEPADAVGKHQTRSTISTPCRERPRSPHLLAPGRRASRCTGVGRCCCARAANPQRRREGAGREPCSPVWPEPRLVPQYCA